MDIAVVHHRDARLGAFTYPRLRFTIEPTRPDAEPEPLDPHYLGVAAWVDGVPVGLALVLRGPSARLCSITVAQPFRRCGIATALLSTAEDAARAEGASLILTVHSDRMAQRTAFEALLRRAGWPQPQLYEVRLAGRADWVERADDEWRGLLDRLAAQGFGTTDWQALDDEDRAHVAALAQAAPENLRPDIPHIFPPVCLAIRRHGTVVGWILGCTTLREDTIRYAVGYVVPALQRTGWLIGGLMDACRRQMAARGPDSIAAYETAPDNRAMQGFMLRRLAGRPGLLRIDRRFWCEKELA